MPRIKLTEDLSRALKNTQNDRGIKTSELATHINKSLSFISKLENGQAEYVDYDLLINIFQFISKKSNEIFEEFLKSLIEKTILEYTPEEIQERDWIMWLDMEYRKIPIPMELISFLNK